MIKVGQIGLNYGLNVHIPAFLNDSRFELVGVCSKNIDKAKRIKDRLSLNFATDNPEELFEIVDAVSLAVPPKEQAIILPKAIEKGLHVFFEKPLGYLPSGEYIPNKLHSLMADFEFLEIDVWQDLKRIILNNGLGRILHAEVIWNIETFAVSQRISSWKTDSKLAGGVLNNFAPHCLHYLEQMMGNILSIDVKPMHHSANSEEVVYIYLQFKSGASASICISSNTYRGSGHFLELTGTDGTARLKNDSDGTLANFVLDVFYKNGKNLKKESNMKSEVNKDDRIPAVSSLVKKFGDWITKGKIQNPNLLDSIRVQNLLETCNRSIIEKKEIQFED